MGLLSFVSQGVSNVAQTFKSIAANTLSSVGVSNNFVSANKSSFVSPIPLAAKVAEHPFATAAIVAPLGAVTGLVKAPTVAATTAKVASSVTSSLGKVAAANPIKTAVAGLIGVPAVISAVKTNPNIGKQTTGLISDTGKSLGKVVGDVSAGNLKGAIADVGSYVKAHPVASAAGAVALAAASTGVVANILNAQNTMAVKANTAATLKSSEQTFAALPLPANPIETKPAAPTSISPPLQGAATSPTPVKAKKKAKKKKAKKKKAKKKAKKKKPKKKKKKAKSIKRKKKKRSK